MDTRNMSLPIFLTEPRLEWPIIVISITKYFSTADISKQEAQLSQRDRETLRVIERFAKSLKVIRNNTIQ